MAEDTKTWAITCVRCTFWVLCVILMFNAAINIIIGLVLEVQFAGTFSSFGAHFQLYSLFLLCSAIIFGLLGIYGSYCLKKYNYFGLTIFGFFVITIAVLQVLSGFTGNIIKGYTKSAILGHMQLAQKHYTTNSDYENAWDFIQSEMQCCGIHTAKEWFKILGGSTVPNSCCDYQFSKCGVEAVRSNNYYTKGCFKKYIDNIDYFQIAISLYAILSGLFNLFIVIYPTYLVRRIYRFEEI